MVAADMSAISKALQYKSVTIGGASLNHHNMDWLTTPGQIGVKEPFELVILQGHSAAAINPKQADIHIEASKKAAALIAERGGKVALYMPHSYVAPHKQADPVNVQKNRDFYVELGNEINALVIPVGLAFAEAYKRNPELKLHKSYDGSHPSRAGTYLAAATTYNPKVVYAAICSALPLRLPMCLCNPQRLTDGNTWVKTRQNFSGPSSYTWRPPGPQRVGFRYL
jgi:hypothetical protein